MHASRDLNCDLISRLGFLNVFVSDLHGLDFLSQICRMALNVNRIADLERLRELEHSHADPPKAVRHLLSRNTIADSWCIFTGAIIKRERVIDERL